MFTKIGSLSLKSGGLAYLNKGDFQIFFCQGDQVQAESESLLQENVGISVIPANNPHDHSIFHLIFPYL